MTLHYFWNDRFSLSSHRWDEEKYFDNYKADMANSKAWGKSLIAIEQQALLALVTYPLTRLFLHQKGLTMGLNKITKPCKTS